MKKAVIYLVIFSVSIAISAGQKPARDYQKIRYAKNLVLNLGVDVSTTYYISNKPVTNREYLIYLSWLESVYRDYPMVLLRAIPSDIRFSDQWEFSLKSVAEGCENRIKSYLFNPRYIDYPVIGLSYAQASAFAQWLTDRYNEYVLIEIKYYHTSTVYDQVNENNFNTEAFLMGQYTGNLRKVFYWAEEQRSFMDLMWQLKILIPSFRLPTKNEAETAAKSFKIENQMKEYPMFDFLKLWQYFEVRENQYVFCTKYDINPAGKRCNLDFDKVEFATNYQEYYLDSPLPGANISNVTKIYGKLNYLVVEPDQMVEVEKDSLGRMPFIIISEDKKNRPLLMKPARKINYTGEGDPKIFRVAVCAITRN